MRSRTSEAAWKYLQWYRKDRQTEILIKSIFSTATLTIFLPNIIKFPRTAGLIKSLFYVVGEFIRFNILKVRHYCTVILKFLICTSHIDIPWKHRVTRTSSWRPLHLSLNYCLKRDKWWNAVFAKRYNYLSHFLIHFIYLLRGERCSSRNMTRK